MQRTLDTTALAGICGVLLIAFFYQFMLGELPCPLCALQRVGFIVAGAALVLNLRAGYSPAHYGVIALTAVAAGSASLRQIALHVVPGSGSYGSALFGFHFYTWAFVGYGALVAYVGAMLVIAGPGVTRERGPAGGGLANAVCVVFLLLAAANVAAFLLECGFGPCPDNPVGYLWWPKGLR
ncbi:MAG: disulfide bond formation protein B [Burkholderiales bacterium]